MATDHEYSRNRLDENTLVKKNWEYILATESLPTNSRTLLGKKSQILINPAVGKSFKHFGSS